MATLTKAEITDLTYNYRTPTGWEFSVNVDNEGALPKMTATGFRQTSEYWYPYGSLQCVHHLTYNDDTIVDILQNYKISHAAAIVQSDVIRELSGDRMKIDFGEVDADKNFDAYNFWQKLTDTTTNYIFCDSVYTLYSYGTTSALRPLQQYLRSYKGNTNDNVNWFRATYPNTVGTYFAPNEGWNSRGIKGWMGVKGMVNGVEKQVGVVRPYIYINTSNNHLHVDYQFNKNRSGNPDFDFEKGEYTINILNTFFNAAPSDSWWNYGNPYFTMVLIPAP